MCCGLVSDSWWTGECKQATRLYGVAMLCFDPVYLQCYNSAVVVKRSYTVNKARLAGSVRTPSIVVVYGLEILRAMGKRDDQTKLNHRGTNFP